MKLFLLASAASAFFLGSVPKPPSPHAKKMNAIAADAMLQHVAAMAQKMEPRSLQNTVS